MPGDPRNEGGHVLRFRREDEDVRLPREVRDGLERSDAVLRGDLFRASRDRVADQNPRGRDDPPHDQAPDERFAHLATPAIPIVFWVSMRSAPRRVPEKTRSFLLLFRPWKLY